MKLSHPIRVITVSIVCGVGNISALAFHTSTAVSLLGIAKISGLDLPDPKTICDPCGCNCTTTASAPTTTFHTFFPGPVVPAGPPQVIPCSPGPGNTVIISYEQQNDGVFKTFWTLTCGGAVGGKPCQNPGNFKCTLNQLGTRTIMWNFVNTPCPDEEYA